MEEIAEEQEGERQLKRVNKQDKTEGTATRSGCAPNKHTSSDELRDRNGSTGAAGSQPLTQLAC